MPDLPDKLASAKEGSRELDALLTAHCFGATEQDARDWLNAYFLEGANLAMARKAEPFYSHCWSYTTSLDAIVSLIGEKLPANGGIDLFVRKGVSTAVIYHSEDGDGEWKASGKTIELAACRALLRALQKGNGHE